MQKIIIDETYIKHLAQEKVFLTRAEFSILACSTKEQALKMHSDDTADLILVDYNLSEMNIDNFCAHIRTNSRLKNVSIVVAASNKREELDRCMMCGVDAIISKPVDHNELLKTVTKLLEISKREQPRVLVKISIVGKTTETFYATSQDISVSGILIETGKEIKVGESVTLSFYFRLNKVSVEGKVVRKNTRGKNLSQYGIEFTRIDEKSSSLIRDFVKISQQSGKSV